MFWKIAAIVAILLWVATLSIWYVVETAPPRYIKSGVLVIDTKTKMIYNPHDDSWSNWDPSHPTKKVTWVMVQSDFNLTDRQMNKLKSVANDKNKDAAYVYDLLKEGYQVGEILYEMGDY